MLVRPVVLATVLGLVLTGLARAEAGAFIRSFYPDMPPTPVATVNDRTLAVPARATRVIPTGGTPVAAPLVAMPTTVTPIPVAPTFLLRRVNDGYLYRHPAFPGTVLYWDARRERWIFRTSESPTGWSVVSREWQLAPP